MTSQTPDPNTGQPQNAPQTPPVPPQPQSAPQPPPPPPPAAPQQPAAAASAAQTTNNVQLNYWLSVFFVWIPALIFFLTEKDKGGQIAKFHRENLNFALLRTAVWLVVVFAWIPVLGWLLTIVAWLGGIVLFVFHIIAAVSAKERLESGQDPNFIFNVPFIK